jgi:leucyl-tRNA synthetase
MTKKIYDPKNIETKWIDKWEKDKIFKTEINMNKKKFHVLDMFPYPSGEGLHVGHAKTFGGSDIFARFKRMQGFNVLHSTGWDAFGLPAEQFAIKMKTNPKIQTKKNTDNFEKQMRRIGLSYDWDRTVNTTSPEFYKWTQWIFKQLYKKEMCFESHEPINWCPSCKTGLANEDLEDGKCERCGSVVEKKPIRQWVIKITDYAEKLLQGLDTVGWHENIKDMQRHWIGKSEGAEIDFTLKSLHTQVAPVEEKFTVFTTRADTLFGCTYCVFAPEHELVKKYLESGNITNKSEVQKYIDEAKNKSEIERGAEGREKTGVKLEGVVAVNPANKEEVPVYIADYVLASYGTGAIMAVPAHDERDREFAEKFNIPIKEVIEPVFVQTKGNEKFRENEEVFDRKGVYCIVRDINTKEFLIVYYKDQKNHSIVTGGVEEGEDIVETGLREIREELGFTNLKFVKKIGNKFHSYFYNNRKKANRGYHVDVLVYDLIDREMVEVSNEEKELHEAKFVSYENIEKVIDTDDILEIFKIYKTGYYTGVGILTNSGKFDGLESEEAKKKITESVGGKMVTKYKLRDWVFARQRYWGEPFPIVFDTHHKSYVVADSELPIVLPDVESYEPTGDGESPLKNIKEWVEVKGKINSDGEFVADPNGETFYRETNTMPQWAGSSWYWLRYMDPKNEKELVSKIAEEYWNQVDIYIGGMEHATRHLIYGRFWNQFLYDQKYISTFEPFARLETVGLVLGAGGVKMSKRLGNVINPDDIAEQFGADTLRLYIAFSSAFHDSFAWDEKAIVGPRRFIERVWAMQYKVDKDFSLSSEDETLMHQTIKKVGSDIEKMYFNTAISQVMILCNQVDKQEKINLDLYKNILKLLAPLIPFVTEEIWQNLGETESIHKADWPKYEEAKCISKEVNMVVQIGGKVRDMFVVPYDTSDEEVIKLAKSTEGYKKWVTEEPKKIIVIKNKLVNVVL